MFKNIYLFSVLVAVQAIQCAHPCKILAAAHKVDTKHGKGKFTRDFVVPATGERVVISCNRGRDLFVYGSLHLLDQHEQQPYLELRMDTVKSRAGEIEVSLESHPDALKDGVLQENLIKEVVLFSALHLPKRSALKKQFKDEFARQGVDFMSYGIYCSPEAK